MKQSRLNSWFNRTIKIGLAVSLTPIIAGLIAASIAGPGQAKPVTAISQLLEGILTLNATAIITLGILVLLLIPVSLVTIAMVVFLIDRDRPSIAISVLLLCFLTVSLVLALT